MTPAQWTPQLVQQRLREAALVERRLPDDARPRGMSSAWPASPVYEFRDMLHWDNPQDGARERVWKSWADAKGAHAHEISRMEEAQGWLSLLEEGQRRCLVVWALTAARGLSVRAVLRKRGIPPSSFYRKLRDGSARIAAILGERGVVVR